MSDDRYTPWGNWHPVSWGEVEGEVTQLQRQIEAQAAHIRAVEADLAEAVQLAKDAQAGLEAAISQLEAERENRV